MAQKYGLDNLIDYQIVVSGHLVENWQDWFDEKTVSIVSSSSKTNTTVLSVTFDQAGLLGLLRRLYYLAMPLISVNHIES